MNLISVPAFEKKCLAQNQFHSLVTNLIIKFLLQILYDFKMTDNRRRYNRGEIKLFSSEHFLTQ